ncbi:MAG: hypothetical protein ACXVRQ_11505 [Gaiellaceae bacterium]
MNDLHPQPQKERPTIPVRLAWRRYLEETRSASFEAYDLVEQLAWQRLARDLTNLGGPLDLLGEQLSEPHL